MVRCEEGCIKVKDQVLVWLKHPRPRARYREEHDCHSIANQYQQRTRDAPYDGQRIEQCPDEVGQRNQLQHSHRERPIVIDRGVHHEPQRKQRNRPGQDSDVLTPVGQAGLRKRPGRKRNCHTNAKEKPRKDHISEPKSLIPFRMLQVIGRANIQRDVVDEKHQEDGQAAKGI